MSRKSARQLAKAAPPKTFFAVSLFSNCGAGDIGFAQAGFRFQVLADIDQRRLSVAELNHARAETVPGDLRETWRRVVQTYRSQAGKERPALLAACPPCQGMSSARSGRGRGDDPDAGSRDERNLLVLPIAQAAAELAPRIIVVENVPAFLTRKVRHPKTRQPVSAASLLISLLDAEYAVFPFISDLANYGVPQTRRRAFLTFVRRGEPSLARMRYERVGPYPSPTKLTVGRGGIPTAEQALARLHLPSLDASTPEEARDPRRPLHFVPVWDDRCYSMVAAIPPGSGRSAWDNNKCGTCGRVRVGAEAATCPRCGGPLLRPVLREGRRYRLIAGFRSSSYRRMNSDTPPSTVTTASGHVGSDRTIHPTENRVLSPLECALLQTFPRDFRWGDALEKWGHTNVRDMIGEAVPPMFTRLHGRVLRGLLTNRWIDRLISLQDTRCRRPAKILGLPDPWLDRAE